MFGFSNITTNSGGVPVLRTTNVSVGTDSVDFALGFRRIPAMGIVVINVTDAIPEGTTGTLPIRMTLNGSTRNLTFFGGTNVTAADLVGTSVIEVFYSWFEGMLQVISPLTPATT